MKNSARHILQYWEVEFLQQCGGFVKSRATRGIPSSTRGYNLAGDSGAALASSNDWARFCAALCSYDNDLIFSIFPELNICIKQKRTEEEKHTLCDILILNDVIVSGQHAKRVNARALNVFN